MPTGLQLGTLKKIEDLRTVWNNEASDFTRWLAEEANLQALGEVVNIDLVLSEVESNVGDFRADIVCTEDGTDDKVIIENQLESSNHEHLGKIITYASGKDAKKIIWIVKTAREEHSKAIEWLNEHTDIDLFLIEIELWRIGDSKVAPKFNIVEKPNGWGKQIKKEGTYSEADKLNLRFWQAFNEEAPKREEFVRGGFHTTQPWERSYYHIRFGVASTYIVLAIRQKKKIASVSLYFRDDKELFSNFREQSAEVEKMLGSKVVWTEGNKDCTLRVIKNTDVLDEATWEETISWACAQSLKMKAVYDRFSE